MIRLKPTQKKILDFIVQYFEDYKNIPLTSEIARATALSRSTVLSVERKLYQLGFIDRFLVGKRMIIMILWKP